jgi:hypothetical protein
MPITTWTLRTLPTLGLALALCACADSSSLSPEIDASVSGVVVSEQTSDPIAGITVDLERCHDGAMMMGPNDWDLCESMMTDSNGRFHFEYRHQSMHRYRVTVRGEEHSHCTYYIGSGDGKHIELRVP